LQQKSRRNFSGAAAVFLFTGALLLGYSLLSGLQVAAFIGLGLVFWGALFIFAKNGKYVESSLVNATAQSAYSTTDRMINDLKLNGQAYYLPAYPHDVSVPQYLSKLREPVVFISESMDGKPSIEELTAGKFLCEKSRGVFIASPGSGLMTQMEKKLRRDFSTLDIEDLAAVLSKSLTEQFNLAKSVEITVSDGAVNLKAAGILYEDLYRANPPFKSLSVLGCPVVSAVASTLAKYSGKIVIIKENLLSPNTSGAYVVFNFI
jgi:hypothetical protein